LATFLKLKSKKLKSMALNEKLSFTIECKLNDTDLQ
jgi:hypothetical protein